MADKRWRIGVDVGGTFTDVAVLDRRTGAVTVVKVSTTPDDPAAGVLTAVDGICEVIGDFDIADVSEFVHGTTITTNALIQRTFHPCALLVTEGMRGSVEVQDQRRVGNVYDMHSGHPDSLVSSDRVFEIPGRISADSKIIRDLNLPAVREIAHRVRDLGVRSVAVCLLFSFANPIHEQQVRDILREESPGLRVSLSSEVLPRIREWPRISTMLLNASLEPLLIEYVDNLAHGLISRGLTHRQLFLIESNGGLMPFSAVTAGGRAVQTLLSGPAAAVRAASETAAATERPLLVTLDMGGTSADVAFVHNAEALEVTEGNLAGHYVYVPMLDIMTVGAGGGTLAEATAAGRLAVGPKSAGSHPGPVCYGRGGTIPTATDADLTLGLLDPTYYLGGRMTVDLELARSAIQELIGAPLGINTFEAAEAVLRLNEAHMADAIRVFAAQRGITLPEATLVACGGAGPLHACGVAAELGIRSVLVPPLPGVFSAVGLLSTDVIQDFVQTDITKLVDDARPAINAQFVVLEARATDSLIGQGFDAQEITCYREVDARYSGQGFELRLRLGGHEGNEVQQHIIDLFQSEHARVYGHAAEGEPIEIVSYRVRAVVRMRAEDLRATVPGSDVPSLTRPPRPVYYRGSWTDAVVVRRSELAASNQRSGPMLIEQPDTTIFAPPGWSVQVDPAGNVVLESKGTAR